MRNALKVTLVVQSLLLGGQLGLAQNIIRVPFGIHPEIKPLVVNSPIEVRWNGGEAMVVEIYKGNKKVFPGGDKETSVASGSEFKLDHGLYQVKVRNPVGTAPLPVSAHRLSIWIEVMPEANRFDLRSSDPGQRSDIISLENMVRRELAALSQRVESMNTTIVRLDTFAAEDAVALKQIQSDLSALRKKFTVSVPGRGNREVAITQPLQWLADQITNLQDELIRK